MKKNWQELFIGFGYEVTEVKEGLYDLSTLNEPNQQLLISVLEKLPLTMVVSTQLLSIKEEAVAEDAWIRQLEKFIDGRSEASYAPTEIPLQKIDLYIAGLVMQLNRLGYVMTYSCDGHERRKPTLYFEKVKYARKAKILLAHFGVESRRRGLQLSFSVNRKTLPEVALKVSQLTREDVERICRENTDLVEEASFNETLEKLLSIRGESGNEDRIREFVIGELEPFTDHIEVDHYGNVVAIKRYGYGPTVLLNAHLDTFEAIVDEREIIKKGDSWSSSDGILGADDRAGVNVVLAVAQSMASSQFKGTMKYIFTVQEEVGLQGARQIAKSFLWDVDMAFVIDRRGTHDIVTSKGGMVPFCTPAFGRELERIARRSGEARWRTVPGGSSDTYIWAQSGIESVNLSAGYMHEHTADETLDVKACYGTFLFVMEILDACDRIVRRGREVRGLASDRVVN